MSAPPSTAELQTRTARAFGWAGLGLTAVGSAASVYLTVAHYDSPAVLACSDKGTINCAKVTTSSYSSQFGIPLAVLGLVFFAVIVALQNPWSWASPSRVVRRARVASAAAGAAAALWLIWVELYKLDAICLYCTVVHAACIALFILTVLGTAATGPVDA